MLQKSFYFSILQLWVVSVMRISAEKDCAADRVLKLKPVLEGKALQGHVITSLMVKKESSCLAHCYVEENCMSYNIGPKLVDNTHKCELSNSDDVLHPEDLVDRYGFTYQPTENACHSNPCPEGSVCQIGFTEKGRRCIKDVKVQPPFVTIIPQMEVTEAGRSVKFTCKVTGEYNPEVKWSRLNASLPDSRSTVNEDSLTILNVTTDDSGSYVCTATNVMGSNSSSVKLQVYAALKFITRPPSSVLVYIGQTLNLSCSASSDLQPSISWMFNGIPSLPQGASIDAFSNLIISSANFTHRGNYTCSATNSLSSLHANVTVYVEYPETCSRVKTNISDVSGDYVIDPDHEEGQAPFTVYCDMIGQGRVGVTVVSHDSEDRTYVRGFEADGNYSRDIRYVGSSLSQIKELTEASKNCQQFIKYECMASTLYERNTSWWVSRDGERMTYWGGATQGCACGMTNSCADNLLFCNCDRNDYVWREDSGFLTGKSHLPVSQLRFGDTGGQINPQKVEQGYHTLGKLECYGMN